MQTNTIIKKQFRVRNFLTWTCLLIIVVIGAYSVYTVLNPDNDGLTALNSALAKLPGSEAPIQTAQYERKIYPYSIVPGGMRSREEVYANIRTDHVVAEHYSGFNVDETRIIQAPKTRSMYVSYRLGDEVFWTAKAVQIPQGETLVTDGIIEARTRCGNQLSATPMTPTSDKEPDAAYFDIPDNEIPGFFAPDQFIGPEQTPMAYFGESTPPLYGGTVPPPFIRPNSPQYNPGSFVYIPPGTGIIVPGTPDNPGNTPDVPNIFDIPDIFDPEDPSTVPEPGTMVMLLTGLAAMVIIGIRRQK
jgi:hypothetical protein